MPELITFLHLSDIHFSKRDRSSPYELDEALRREIEHDSGAQSGALGGVTGILVTGDIAFSGQPSEYANVRSWLAELSSRLKIPPENVWVVPGNHDIDWSVQDGDEVAAALRHKLRTVPLDRIDENLETLLGNEEAAVRLFAPLREYQRIATDYACRSEPSSPAWSARVDLGPYVVLLRGVNTVLVSDRTDHPDDAPLVVGRSQTQLLRSKGIVHLTLSHHPRSWIRDGDACLQDFDNRAVVQLSGHDHRFETTVRGNSLCVAAGAAHPSRAEPDWEPRYNFVSLELSESHPPSIHVTVHSRVWDPNRGEFDMDPGSPVRHDFAMDDVTAVDRAADEVLDGGEAPLNDPEDQYAHSVPEQKAETIANRGRHLAHRLALLRSGDRRSVAAAIGVPVAELARKRPDETVEVIMDTARAEGGLAALWDAVESAHGARSSAPNPYSDGGGTDRG